MFYPVRQVKILSGSRNNTFGWVRKGGTKVHQGWDFQAFNGSELFAVAAGEIVSVVRVDKEESDYGCSINLKFKGAYGEDLYAFYAHVSPNILVSKGDQVMEGALIGYSGSTGNARYRCNANKWMQHLHFEFRDRLSVGFGLEGRINPEFFFGMPPFDWIEGGKLANDVTHDWYETPAPELYSSY
jgi:murein DD-endopeptidase MepM/ murein hydrolase activator NlpD